MQVNTFCYNELTGGHVVALLQLGGTIVAKTIQGQGSFEIQTSKNELARQIMKIERIGRICYQSERKRITMKTATEFVRMLIKRKHDAMLEHGGTMTVRFSNCSRGFTHELVRHRIAGFGQESTRFVDYTKKGGNVDLDRFQLLCIAPPHRDSCQKVELGDGRKLSLADMFDEVEQFYRALRQTGWRPEDARQILPIGLKSQIGISANPREWRHIFSLRTAKPAHWEIRYVMCNLLETVQSIVPALYEDFHEAGVDKNGLRYFEQRLPE